MSFPHNTLEAGDGLYWHGLEDDLGSDIPCLNELRKKRQESRMAMNEMEWIECQLRREDEIKQILELAGLSSKTRVEKLTEIQTIGRSLKSEFNGLIGQFMALEDKIESLVHLTREYELSVMHKAAK